LLLMGSPKPDGSTSAALGEYVVGKLKAAGFSTKTMHVGHEMRDEGGQMLAATIDAADLVILATPLYVDAAPAPVTRMMERVARHRRKATPEKRPRFVAIVNCGFPEGHHNDTALAIYRRFADEAGLAWAGGLGIGMGGAIGGRAVEKLGSMGRNLRQALDVAAEALVEGKDVPEEAAALAAKPFMPRWIYVAMAHHGWRRQAAEHDARRKLRDQPHKATE
jgi:multimeric flavodoxin WrbA